MKIHICILTMLLGGFCLANEGIQRRAGRGSSDWLDNAQFLGDPRAAKHLTEDVIKLTNFTEAHLKGTNGFSCLMRSSSWHKDFEKGSSNYCLKITADHAGTLRLSSGEAYAYPLMYSDKESALTTSAVPCTSVQHSLNGVMNVKPGQACYVYFQWSYTYEAPFPVTVEWAEKPPNDSPGNFREIVIPKNGGVVTFKDDATLAGTNATGRTSSLFYALHSEIDGEIMVDTKCDLCLRHAAYNMAFDVDSQKIGGTRGLTPEAAKEFRTKGRLKVEKGGTYFMRLDLDFKEPFEARIWTASPPANDNLANPEEIVLKEGGAKFLAGHPFATTEPGEDIQHKNSVWYRLKPPAGGFLRFKGHDRLSIYRDWSGQGRYQELETVVESHHGKWNDQYAGDGPKSFVLKVENQKEYLVCFDGVPAEIEIETVFPPANDMLKDARTVELEGFKPWNEIVDFSLATIE